ncbi:hypothetical protein QPK87_07360 [Kamptonema cortianum]|nr:hypothetical protein [Geitlerinema splendidum]MDK3156393.1 hypothetical protein [Kamptonema cortianum]
MGRDFSFLLIGVAVGFILANAVRHAQEAEADPDKLVDNLEKRLDQLESQFTLSS